MSDAWDEAVDPVDDDMTERAATRPRPIRGGPGGRGRSDIGPDDVLRLVRGLTGAQDDSLSSTLRSLANRFGVPELGSAASATDEERSIMRARSALLTRIAELAETADAEQLAHLTETWALLSGPRVPEA
jgi:hypothetical protein